VITGKAMNSGPRRTIAIVWSESHIKRIISFHRQCQPEEELLFVSIRSEVDLFLREKATLPSRPLDSFTLAKSFIDIEDEAARLSPSWHVCDGRDVTFFDGLSFGDFVGMDIYFFWRDLVATIELIRAIVTQEKPTEIVYVDDRCFALNIILSYGDVITLVCNNLDVETTALSADLVTRLRYLLQRHVKFSLIWYLRDHVFRLYDIYNRVRYKIRRSNWRRESNIGSATVKRCSSGKGSKLQTNLVIVDYPFRMLPPVVKKLQQRSRVVVLASTPEAYSLLAEQGLPYVTFQQYHPRGRRKAIRNKLRRLKKMGQAVLNDDEFRAHLSYGDLPLWHAVEEQLKFEFFHRFPRLLVKSERVRNLLRLEKPDCIVVSLDCRTYTRVPLRIGEQLDIPSVLVQHAITTGNRPLFPFVPFLTDKQAVWGDAAREWFLERGVDPERLVVTGSPSFDHLFHKETSTLPSKEKLCALLGLDAEKKIYVLATEPILESDNERSVNCVLEAMKSVPQAQLIIKLHPAEGRQALQWYRNLVQASGLTSVVVVSDLDIHSLLKHCDCLMTYDSTVGLEAMLLDKPVIIINPTGHPYRVPYVAHQAALGVHTEAEMLPAIQSIGDPQVMGELLENARRFSYHYAYLPDGQAAKRVADLVMEVGSTGQSASHS
jgi:hypothetical protein